MNPAGPVCAGGGVQLQPDDHSAGDAPADRRRSGLYPPGQGTFIRKNFLQLSQWDLSGSDYFGATKTWEHLGTVTSRVVHFELRFPNEKEQASLMINADAPIYDFIRSVC
jgi:hypothetical protein